MDVQSVNVPPRRTVVSAPAAKHGSLYQAFHPTTRTELVVLICCWTLLLLAAVGIGFASYWFVVFGIVL